MDRSLTPLHAFRTHGRARNALHALHEAAFDMNAISLIGKRGPAEETAAARHVGMTAGDSMGSWATHGAFWAVIWRLKLVPAVFVLPGLGVVAVAGPLAAALARALEGAVPPGASSILGAALDTVGVPHVRAADCDTALKSSHYIVVVHGTDAERAAAGRVLAEA